MMLNERQLAFLNLVIGERRMKRLEMGMSFEGRLEVAHDIVEYYDEVIDPIFEELTK